MLFNSGVFVVLFLPIVVIGYYLINKLNRRYLVPWDLIWLFLSSLVFYGYEKPIFVLLILLSIFINYFLTVLMGRTQKYRRGLLCLGLLFNFGLLFYFKYYNFFMSNLYALQERHWTLKNIILPLGISFFTFQQVSYLIDYYRDAKDMQYSFWEYAAFVSFFPQLVAGPIVLHKELIPQFRDKTKKIVDYDNLSRGLYAFSLGLGKKVLLADTLSKIVAQGFRDVLLINTGTGLMVMLAYTLQIYFDFSGYCDMAIGIAQMFNFTLPINFHSPYKAGTIREFWKRWHITLTRFFTNYVYFPLGGSRQGKLKTYRNTFLIFLLSGLWHGANWTFIVWGALHGTLMVVEKIFSDYYKCIPLLVKRIFGFFYRLFILLFINITWIIFRADSLTAARSYLRGLLNGKWDIDSTIIEKIDRMLEIRVLSRMGLGYISNLYPTVYLFLFLGICSCGVLFLKNTQEKMWEDKYHLPRMVTTLVLILWCVFSFSEVGEFLYFNF